MRGGGSEMGFGVMSQQVATKLSEPVWRDVEGEGGFGEVRL